MNGVTLGPMYAILKEIKTEKVCHLQNFKKNEITSNSLTERK